MTAKDELGTFLRARRARLRPADVGLPPGIGLRRTPGLRREELSVLAGVSIDYYTRLEQGRETNPSGEVLDALAAALRLDDDGHSHLYALANQVARRTPPPPRGPSRTVRPGVALLIEAVRPFPAYVLSRTSDVLAANPETLLLFTGLQEWPERRRNTIRYVFLHPAARSLLADWTHSAETAVANLRGVLADDPEATELAVLVEELTAHSPDFVRLWSRYDVNPPPQPAKDLPPPSRRRRHPSPRGSAAERRGPAAGHLPGGTGHPRPRRPDADVDDRHHREPPVVAPIPFPPAPGLHSRNPSTQRETTMPSKQSEGLRNYWLSSNAAAAADPPLPQPEMQELNEHWGDVTAEPGGVDYVETDAGGVPAMWAAPKGCAEDRVLLCLHGGGFVGGSMYTHRKLFGHLAKAVGARALIVDYRRTPQYQHPAPLDDVTAAYRWLLGQGIAAGHIAVTGDSAGGGLTVTTMLRARELGLPAAAALMPLSPWFDFELVGESWVSNRYSDVLFGGATPMDVAGLARMFLGETGDPRDPLVSPLFADLTGLPPIYIQVSRDEMLADDSRRFDELARKAGVSVRLDEVPEMQHTFQMSAGRAPEADKAIRDLAEWVRPLLGL